MSTITHTDIWKFSIPMNPFTIATGTMRYAQNIFIRVHTDDGKYGVGECSAFPMITGETQTTCYEMAKEFAMLWKNTEADRIDERLQQLDDFAAYNTTIKSAFDMALYDLASMKAGVPLYAYLGGSNKPMQTDLTIGIDEPERMAAKAVEFVSHGVRILKIKLGKDPATDIERIRKIRAVVGPDIKIRVDANQGWSYSDAVIVLRELSSFDIEFCEQPVRHCYDDLLPTLRNLSNVPLMADESVYDHHDAARLINARATDYINIKLAKSGGIREAVRIHEVCTTNNIVCMMGGMLESRIALTAFGHFATAHEQIKFYDMDTCLLGHLEDPVVGGARYENFHVHVPELPGIGADADENFLNRCEKITV